MLRQVWAMTRKDLRLFARHPGEWSVIFLTPFVFIAIIGQIFGNGGTPTVAIYAVNEDKGTSGRQVIERLQDQANLQVTILSSRSEADRRMGAGRRLAAVVVPHGFTEALTTSAGGRITLIIDPARRKFARLAVGLINAALGPMRIDAEVTRGVGRGVDAALEQFAGQRRDADLALLKKFVTAAVKGVVSTRVQDAVDDPLVQLQLRDVWGSTTVSRPPTLMESLVPGYTFMFAFFLLSSMANTVLEERHVGTFRRLLSTPMSRFALLLGKIFPYFIIVVVQVLVLLGVSNLAFEVSMGESLPALLLITATSAAAVVGLGMLVASLVKTEGQAGVMPRMLGIVLAAVSGAMSPDIRVQLVQYATPHYWAIRGFQDVISRDLGVSAVLTESGILLGMATLCFGLGVSRLRLTD